MRNKKYFLAILVLLLLSFLFLTQRKKTSTITVGERTLQIEVAKTEAEKEKGLSGRASLCANCGMLFLFEEPGIYPFWMRKMYFDIDILWIRGSQVVDITYGAQKPPTAEINAPKTIYQSQVPVDKVLEVNAGWVQQNEVKMGDEVVISKDKR